MAILGGRDSTSLTSLLFNAFVVEDTWRPVCVDVQEVFLPRLSPLLLPVLGLVWVFNLLVEDVSEGLERVDWVFLLVLASSWFFVQTGVLAWSWKRDVPEGVVHVHLITLKESWNYQIDGLPNLPPVHSSSSFPFLVFPQPPPHKPGVHVFNCVKILVETQNIPTLML